MEVTRPHRVEVVRDVGAAAAVMGDVGAWMQEAGMVGAEKFSPEKMNPGYLSGFADPDQFAVVKFGDKPAAAAVIRPESGQPDADAIEVRWLAVARDFASRGMAVRLLLEADQVAREQGLPLVRFSTEPDRHLCDFFESLGFRQVESADANSTAVSYQRPVV